MKFLSNQRIHSYVITFRMKEYLIFSRPSFRCLILIIFMTFMHDYKYFVYSNIEFIFSIYSYYLFYANIGVYQKSYDFI